MTKTGLYLGKFAPLHKGHQYVLETAIEETDKVYLIIYDEPDVIDVPVTVREQWINDLYPEVTTIQAWNGPEETGYTRAIQNAHEDYIDKLLPDDVDITHFYSSEPYGDHMSQFLGAEDRRIDPDRETVPISGTKVRNDTYGNKEYVSDRVYRDLITNVVFLGGPSTGKSTLTERLADEFDTEYMPEFGREYWEKHAENRRLTQDQLIDLAEEHIEREDQHLLDSKKYLFTDTNALTTATFSQYYHNEIPEKLWNLAKNTHHRYDIHIVCDTDIPYDNTEGRSGEANRDRLQKHTIALLEQFSIPYHVVSGTVEERVKQVKEILNSTNKWELEIS